MRIRKRHVLFSSLLHSPVTQPSDPHSPPAVQLGDDAAPPPSPLFTSDPPINGCDDPSSHIGGAHKQHIKQEHPPSEGEGEDDGGGRDEIIITSEDEDSKEKKGNHHHSRKGAGIFGSQTRPVATPSSTQDGIMRWCGEDEKAIPFKKRRSRGSCFDHHEESRGSAAVKARMKTKMNKKCSSNKKSDNDNDDEDYTEVPRGSSSSTAAKPNNNNNGKKKRGRGSGAGGGGVMEGSRCSRVNGRGWRCCQQTLVGYSLCEHHLGKGRLRSMTSVRNRSTSVTTTATAITDTAPSTTTTTKVVAVQQDDDHDTSHDHHHHENHLSLSPSSSSPLPEKQTKFVADCGGNEEKKKPAIMGKKRMKQLGMVKARSISSLLGQTSNTSTGIAMISHETNK